MGIFAKDSGSGDFTPAPEGQWQGVCVDVVDLGLKERIYNNEKKMRQEIRIVFQLSAKNDAGNEIRTESKTRFSVSRLFGLNLSDRGSLRPFLESWRGRKFTAEELESEKKGFDVEKLLGANALIQVVHNKNGDKTYANIQSIMPWNSSWGAKIEPENFTRKIDRDKQAPAEASAPRSMSAGQALSNIAAGVPPSAAIPQPSSLPGGEDDVPF